MLEDLLVEGGRVTGVVTQSGLRFKARGVVLTVGTFLAGRIHVGLTNYSGGRAGDPASVGLAALAASASAPAAVPLEAPQVDKMLGGAGS